MAVRPQEELPGLEGSSEVILSLSLPPGRTAPPPANPHTQRPPHAVALLSEDGEDGDHPAWLPHLSPGTLFLHQGHS